MEFYKKNIESFDQWVWWYIMDSFDLDNIKVVVVAGPGNPKDRFLNKIKNINNFEID